MNRVPELGASRVVDEEVDAAVENTARLGDVDEKKVRVIITTSEPHFWFKQMNDSDDDVGQREDEKLDGECDEHLGDGRFFLGVRGRRLLSKSY